MSELYTMSLSAMMERLQAQSGEIATLTAMVAERDRELVDVEAKKQEAFESANKYMRLYWRAQAHLERFASAVRKAEENGYGQDEPHKDDSWIDDLGAAYEIYTRHDALAPPAAEPVQAVSDVDLRDAIAEALGDAMDCMRVWSAWGVGTMGPGDFALVAEDGDRLQEIVDAVKKVLTKAQPAPATEPLTHEEYGSIPLSHGKPLITNQMKSECLGKFGFNHIETCTACHFDVPDDDCEVCGGDVEYNQRLEVPWIICKEIYRRMATVAMKYNDYQPAPVAQSQEGDL